MTFTVTDVGNWNGPRLPESCLQEQGCTVELQELAVKHIDSLAESLQIGLNTKIWDFLPEGPFESKEAFSTYIEGIIDKKTHQNAYFYSIVECATGNSIGMASYSDYKALTGNIELAYLTFSPSLQRSRMSTEAIHLMIKHAFETYGYRRVAWRLNNRNQPSHNAAKRFGFKYEGLFRNHLIVKGVNRDTAWYAMTDGDWVVEREVFRQWLAADNFDADGIQKKRLDTVRQAIVV